MITIKFDQQFQTDFKRISRRIPQIVTELEYVIEPLRSTDAFRNHIILTCLIAHEESTRDMRNSILPRGKWMCW